MSNCFMPVSAKMDGADQGPLSGLTFAAKANYDIAGFVTANGSPHWAASHGPATSTAPSIDSLLAAGADLVGTVICDELCFSINGENAHYGTPLNPLAPGRIPGGSSSGSASVVACQLSDFALGSDTSGSIRLPASYCGIFGLRGTHDLLPANGVVPLAQSFDAIGWFARSPRVLSQVGSVLWADKPMPPQHQPRRLLVPVEAIEHCDPELAQAFDALLPELAAALDLDAAQTVSLGDLAQWREHLRAVQAREIWTQHRAWIEANSAGFGPGMEHRLRWGERVSDSARDAGKQARTGINAQLRELLSPGTLLVMPTAPGPAPLLNTPAEEQTGFRDRAIALTCIASLAGLPELSMPLLEARECPVGVSLIGARAQDSALATAAQTIWSALQ